jgi:hypothetical protein
MPMKTILVSLLAITYVIFESIWATVLAKGFLKVFWPETNFNIFVLFGICAIVLNSFDILTKCDSELKTALRVNTFIWLLIITIVEFSIDAL